MSRVKAGGDGEYGGSEEWGLSDGGECIGEPDVDDGEEGVAVLDKAGCVSSDNRLG